MDSIGKFLEVKIDGKPYLVFHPPKYQLPQIDTSSSSSSSSGDVAMDSGGHDLSLQPLFACPFERFQLRQQDEVGDGTDEKLVKFTDGPYFHSTRVRYEHQILPLYWCNNIVENESEVCNFCLMTSVGRDRYFCVTCDSTFHKECVESPLHISYPSHLKHILQLKCCPELGLYAHCIGCRKLIEGVLYHCATLDIFMHALCAQATIQFFVDQPKRHDHTLALFFRQPFLICNVCGLINELFLIYVCPPCNFVSHVDCLSIPNVIRVSRHNHRVYFTSSRQPGEWPCGVCRRQVDNDYGAYNCNKCTSYVVHVRCALRRDVWDGEDLDGVPEEDDDEDVEPFERIADGVIHHYYHQHLLYLEISKVYDANKLCEACILPVYKGEFFSCRKCEYILHKACASSPLKKVHPLYPFPLHLAIMDIDQDMGVFDCDACSGRSYGFLYTYMTPYSFNYILDMRCASISEPFEYQGHKHPLFLASSPGEKPICHVCKSAGKQKVLNCIECDYILCFKCATLPYVVRYKHDEHELTFCHGDEASDSDWCELCEGKLAVGGDVGFYQCSKCCTTLHISCLLGSDPFLKPGEIIAYDGDYKEFRIHRNSSTSRPICSSCHRRCQYPIFLEMHNDIICSYKCMGDNDRDVIMKATVMHHFHLRYGKKELRL